MNCRFRRLGRHLTGVQKRMNVRAWVPLGALDVFRALVGFIAGI